MAIFETVESVSEGRYFWRALERLKRLPFDCVDTGRSATLLDKDRGLALLVVPQDETGPSPGFFVIVRLLGVSNDEVLVEACLDRSLNYVDGSAFGLRADELAASETLSMCGAGINGEWSMVEVGDLEEEGEENE